MICQLSIKWFDLKINYEVWFVLGQFKYDWPNSARPKKYRELLFSQISSAACQISYKLPIIPNSKAWITEVHVWWPKFKYEVWIEETNKYEVWFGTPHPYPH